MKKEEEITFRVLPVLKGKKEDLLSVVKQNATMHFATKTKYAICFNDVVEYFVSLGMSNKYHDGLIKSIAEEFITNLSNELGEEQGGIIQLDKINIFYFYVEGNSEIRNENDPENVPLVFLELEAYLEALWQFIELKTIKLKALDVSEDNFNKIEQTIENIKIRFNRVQSKLEATFTSMN